MYSCNPPEPAFVLSVVCTPACPRPGIIWDVQVENGPCGLIVQKDTVVTVYKYSGKDRIMVEQLQSQSYKVSDNSLKAQSNISHPFKCLWYTHCRAASGSGIALVRTAGGKEQTQGSTSASSAIPRSMTKSSSWIHWSRWWSTWRWAMCKKWKNTSPKA